MKVLKSKIAMLLVIAMVLSNGGTLVLAESIDDVVSETQNTELNSQSKASVYYEELEITEANDDVVGADTTHQTVGADIIRPSVEANEDVVEVNDDETIVGEDTTHQTVEANDDETTVGADTIHMIGHGGHI